jgi:hypothetical protein
MFSTNSSASASFIVAASLIVVLIGLRLFLPEHVVGQNLGFVLGFASSGLFLYGVVEKKGVVLHRTTPVYPLVIVSVFFSTLTLDYLLHLNYFEKNQSPFIAFVLLPFLQFICFGWWVLFKKPRGLWRKLIYSALAATSVVVILPVLWFRYF